LPKTLKIAINTRLLLEHQLEGIGRYTFELFSRMVRQQPEHEFHFIFDRKFDPQFIFANNITPHVVYPPVRHPFLAKIWFDFQIKRTLKKIQPDVFISPDGMNSLNPVCKTITVFHDVNFAHHPEFFPFFLRKYYINRTPIIAHRSERIVTVSEYSANDIAETYGINRKKIDVIYNSVGNDFSQIDEERKMETRKKYAEGKPYFVFIGGMYHRKNLVNQFRAFEIFKKENASAIKMVYVGQVVDDASELKNIIERSEFKEDVHVLGRKSESDMKLILGSSLALTYVSTLEGFGIPMLEAMKSGVPVITGNSSSMPEICGGAALYADSKNPQDIANQMKVISNDELLRKDLIAKALERAEFFSWDEGSKKFWRVIERLVSTE